MIKLFLNKIKTSKIVSNSIWIMGEQLFQLLMSFIIGIISARYLGPSNYGALNYTASFVTFFTSIATLGMDGVIIKKMIQNPKREGEYLGSCIILRLISGIISSVIVSFVVWFFNMGNTLKLTLIILQTFQLIFSSVHILDSWFQRYLNSKYVSIAKIIGCCVVSIYRVYLLITIKDIRWFAFSNSLLSIIVALMLLILFKLKSKNILKFKLMAGLDVLKDSYHFIIAGLAVAIYGQMDRIMLGSMISDTSVGYYTTAAILCSCWTFVPNSIINSFRPKIMELKEAGNEELYLYRLEQVYSLIIWISIIVAIIVCLMGRFVIKILYGEAYLGTIGPLYILIWSEIFALMGNARSIWILSENKNKYVKYYLSIGIIINLILNIILIPWFKEIGAAIATLITQVFTTLIAPLFFRETYKHTKYIINSFLLKWYFRS